MGVREQLIRDCVLLGDFAVKSVETMKAGDEKGVVRLYTGASQANVLMLLTELVDHLAVRAGRWLTRCILISYNTFE